MRSSGGDTPRRRSLWLVLALLGCSALAGVGSACSPQEESVESHVIAATEIIDAVITRHYGDGGTGLDVWGLFKGDFVPKDLRGQVHGEAETGRMGEPAHGFLHEGQRYVIFVYHHYFVDPATVFPVREEDGVLMCQCPDGESSRWMGMDEFEEWIETMLASH